MTVERVRVVKTVAERAVRSSQSPIRGRPGIRFPPQTIVVVNEDAAGNEIKKTWRLVYDYRSIAKIEKAIGRDIKKISSWKDLSSGTDFPAIVHGGLNRYHPDVTLDEVLDVLNPAAQRVLSDEIFYLMFPGMREVIEKQAETGAAADSNPPAATLSA